MTTLDLLACHIAKLESALDRLDCMLAVMPAGHPGRADLEHDRPILIDLKASLEDYRTMLETSLFARAVRSH